MCLLYEKGEHKTYNPCGCVYDYHVTHGMWDSQTLILDSNPHHLIEPVFIGKELNVGKSFAKCKSV